MPRRRRVRSRSRAGERFLRGAGCHDPLETNTGTALCRSTDCRRSRNSTQYGGRADNSCGTEMNSFSLPLNELLPGAEHLRRNFGPLFRHYTGFSVFFHELYHKKQEKITGISSGISLKTAHLSRRPTQNLVFLQASPPSLFLRCGDAANPGETLRFRSVPPVSL